MKYSSMAAAALLLAGGASADTGAGIRLGTLGVGLDVSQAVGDGIHIRANANFYDWNRSMRRGHIDYDGKLELRSFGALADWYPWRQGFRLSGGLYLNENRVKLHTDGSRVTLNGVTFDLSGSAVESVDARIRFNDFAPYIGIGWGSYTLKPNTWNVIADLGVLYQQTPRVSLRAVCGPLATPAICAQIQSQAAGEEEALRDDVRDYRWYPVLSVGVSYSF